MSDSFQQLLQATIRYLEEDQSRGRRFVHVSGTVLDDLVRSGTSARPQTSSRSVPSSRAPQPVAPATRPAPAPAPEVLRPAVIRTPEEKEAVMAELRRTALECQKCSHLAAARRNVVFGVGNIHASLMFVGEAPGADEDQQGEPFVGKAGQLLTRIIQAMGLARDQVYIGNILKCRPDTPGQAYGNRRPTLDEMEVCKPFVVKQIEIIQPRVIVALGATAMEGLFGKGPGITRQRGRFKEFSGCPVMPTYHPAYLLRNEANSEKRKVWEDMLQVMEKLQLPISDKQRRFFLPRRTS